MPRLALIILLLSFFALPATAQDEVDVDQLIEDLASEDWATRERASRKLAGLDEKAVKPLRGALEDDDPEVRVRASAALIEIGEEFAYAVNCATSESEYLREHGRAALMNLFRIDDDKVFRELTASELQTRYYGWNTRINLQGPPLIVLARLQALSGLHILVDDEAKEQWQRAMEKPTVSVSASGDLEEIAWSRGAVQQLINNTQGNAEQDNKLAPRPLRIGRSYLIYVTLGGSSTGVARRCGDQMIDDLLGDGEPSVRAASMLAQAAASDSKAIESIRRQYIDNRDLTRLMWLALALGADDELTEIIRARQHDDAVALLIGRDWSALELAGEYLNCLAPDVKGQALGETIAGSQDSIALTNAIWIARGAEVSPAARERVGRLVSSKQDALAAASARWFSGVADLTDAELELIWKAGEFQPIDSRFFSATLELVAREEIAGRLVGRARKALTGIFHTQQALAAAVLADHANQDDLEIALSKVNGARNMRRLAQQLAALFDGVTGLSDESLNRFKDGLIDNDAGVRGAYMMVLRHCAPSLQVKVARLALKELVSEGDGEEETLPDDLQVNQKMAYIRLHGILAGQGQSESLDILIDGVEGEDLETARTAGAAFADAFRDEALFTALEDLKNSEEITNGAQAALAGYIEICQRAVNNDDRVTFRRAYGVAINMEILNQDWQLRNQVQQMQSQFGRDDSDADESLLPPDPALNQLEVQVQ